MVNQELTSKCREVCGEGVSVRAFAKICLISVYPDGRCQAVHIMYAILDEQSNRGLGSISLRSKEPCSHTHWRHVLGYMVESVDEKMLLPLPLLLECNQVTNNHAEIPTPNAAHHHSHLRSFANENSQLYPTAGILLLLGRDILQVQKVRKQVKGPNNAPFTFKLGLGWVVVGDVSLCGAYGTLV